MKARTSPFLPLECQPPTKRAKSWTDQSQSNRYIMDSAQKEAGVTSQPHFNGQEMSYYQSSREDSQRRHQDSPLQLPNQVPVPQMDTPPCDSGKSSQVSSSEGNQCSTANRVDSEMQNDEKRSDFFVGQNNGGAWDPRNGAEPREAARAPNCTANTQSSSMTSRLRVAQSKGAEDSQQQPWHTGSTTTNPGEEGGSLLPPSSTSSGVRWDVPQQHPVQSVIQRSTSGLAAMQQQQGSGNPTHPTQCSSVPTHGSNSHQSPGANQPSSLLAMQQPGAQHSNIPEACRRHSWQTTSEDDGHSSSDHLLGAVGGREEPPSSSGARTTPRAPPLRLGLLGGGESSLNNGGSGWGAPPPGGPASGWGSGASAGGTAQWGSAPGGPGRPGAQGQPGDYNVQGEGSTGLSPPKQGQQHNSWAQAAGKGLLPNQQGPQGSNSGTNGDQASSTSSASSSSSSAVQQPGGLKPVVREEPISELRRAAAYSEGWGQTTINQESAWDAPPSPQPNPKDMPACPGPMWRAPANTGTEIWESSMRSRGKAGGAAGAQQGGGGGSSFYQGEENTQQQVWAPQMHIGGTWGEDDDEMSSANLWTGTPAQSGGGNGGQGGPSNHMGEGQSWGHHGGGEKHWGGGGPPPPPPPKSANWGGDDHGGVPDNGTSVWGGGNSGPPKNGPSMPSGMPSGMPGGPQGPPPGPPGNASWSAPVGGPPKRGPDPSTGWEEPSPPASRRPNFDDGTAVWGNPTRQGKVSHWKDMPSVRHQHEGKAISGGGPPPGMLRVPKEGGWGNKPGGRANWGGGENWGEDKGSWGEPTSPMGAPGYWGAKPKGPPNWADGQIDTSTWGGPAKQAGKPLTKDLICASKQFRLLTEMGYKKEDVENALRCNSMNLEDTLMDLQAMSRNDAMDGEFLRSGPKGMRGDDSGDQHGSGGPMEGGPPYAAPAGGFHGSPSGGFQGLPIFGAGYGAAQGFKPPVKGSGLNGNTATSLLSGAGMGGASAGGQNSSLSNGISSLSPALVHKILQQQQVQPPPFGPPAANAAPNPMGSQVGGRLGQPNVPSAAQLRLLVQQIQMAVHAGHLNPQILNQPLAPQTLQLLYQLLQQIKVLHALQQQQQVLHTKGGQPPLQLNVQLTQTKQRIVNLQNQIAAQQALFLKQQVQPPPQPPSNMEQPPPPPFLATKPPNDPSGLHTDFRDLSLKDNSASQSRLNQWKLPTAVAPPPSFEEEPKNSQPQQNGEFSRAPGPASKAGPNGGGSSGLHPLLGHNDGPWSTRAQDSWPDATSTTTTTSSVTSDGKDNGSYSLTDLVAEFEPGKPWKGTSTMKSAEDDPHLTPGSVVRSPLSLNTIKDTELFGGWKHNSPGGGAANEGSLAASLASLTSSTWAFTPAMHGNSSSSMNKQGSKSSWGSIGSEHQQHQHVQHQNSDPWGAPHKNTRGPPPGIPSSSQGMFCPSFSAVLLLPSKGNPSSPVCACPSPGWDQNSCTFLVLKNLTPQIDGSTLKTLCMQHGPLQLFHLFLKHGLALAQYSSREEAAKAQSALHNCVLSNTTMLAYIPTEAEVAQFLQLANSSAPHTWPAASSYAPPRPQAPPPVSSTAAPSFAPTRPKPADAPWNLGGSSHLWSFPGGGGGLWAAPPLSGVGPGSSDHDHPSSSLHSFLPGDLLSGESM
ncbi:protein Gawky-like isoform X3 [Ornithodoros turicata]|uniref:protein Gawky-like isoform X3 n=1 Tax=Ornithodoros turicata TaxID=34597 RepID=UPI00313964AC